MHPFKMIALTFLLLPVAELVAFLLVASWLGFAIALLLLILVSMIGVLVVRRAGSGAVTRLRTISGGATISGVTLNGAGTATALGGILMIIPGFITGLLGAMIMLPRARGWLLTLARRWFTRDRRPGGPHVVDLTPDEWKVLPSPRLAPRRRRRKSDPSGAGAANAIDSN